MRARSPFSPARICCRCTNGIRTARSIFSAHAAASTRFIASARRRTISASTCSVSRISIRRRCRCARPKALACPSSILTRDGHGQDHAKPANAAKVPRHQHKQKRRLPKEAAFCISNIERGAILVLGRPGSDLLSQGLSHSTIGAEAFNGRVRDGIGLRRFAKTTRPAKDKNTKQAIFDGD